MTIYSTINYLMAEGEKDGKIRGHKEGACSQLSKLLRRHGKRRFGEPSDELSDLLHSHADRLDQDVEEMFGTVGTFALASLAKYGPERLPEVVRRMEEAITTYPDVETRCHLWTMAYQCMGLRYPADQVNPYFAHVMPLLYQQPDCKSALSCGYYQGHSDGQSEGAVQATRNWVLALGSQRLGTPEPRVAQALQAIPSVERLEQLAGLVCKAGTWQEVLALN